MKKLIVASLAAATMALGGITVAAPGNAAPESSHIAGQIMVKFRSQAAEEGILRQHGLNQGSSIGSTGAHLIKVPAGKELQLIEALNRNPNVEYAEPDQVVTVATDDQFFDYQYALQNTGRSFPNNNPKYPVTVAEGTPDADADAVEAWTAATGAGSDAGTTEGVRVAVLDSGVDDNHEDITSKVVDSANFSGEATNDDLYGHGTHVAGIVAATANNTVGVAGVCPDCTILDVKVLNDSGSGSTSGIVNGINWAVEKSAKVINMSLGQRVSSRTLETAVNKAWNKGVVIVAAAGNGGSQAKIYPGAYPNVIAVAATDNNDAKASFSTYGSWVDVAAPGVSVYSTFPNHPFVLGSQNNRAMGYDIGSGTSMASPVAAGVAALVWSKQTGPTNTSVRGKVESSADATVFGTGSYWKHGRVDACAAVDCVQP